MQDLYISIVVTNVGENHILLRGGVSRFHFSYLAPHTYAWGGMPLRTIGPRVREFEYTQPLMWRKRKDFLWGIRRVWIDKEVISRPSPPSLSKWPHQSLVPPHQQRCQRRHKIHHTAHRDRCALILTTLLSPSFFKWFLFLCDTTSMRHEIQTFSYLRSKSGETPHSVRLAHPSIPTHERSGLRTCADPVGLLPIDTPHAIHVHLSCTKYPPIWGGPRDMPLTTRGPTNTPTNFTEYIPPLI